MCSGQDYQEEQSTADFLKKYVAENFALNGQFNQNKLGIIIFSNPEYAANLIIRAVYTKKISHFCEI